MSKRITIGKEFVEVRVWAWSFTDGEEIIRFASVVEAAEFLAAECTKTSRLFSQLYNKIQKIADWLLI